MVQPSIDPDGEKVMYMYNWKAILSLEHKNIVHGPAEFAQNTLPGKHVKAGEIWQCSVIPRDSLADGDVSSATIEISP